MLLLELTDDELDELTLDDEDDDTLDEELRLLDELLLTLELLEELRLELLLLLTELELLAELLDEDDDELLLDDASSALSTTNSSSSRFGQPVRPSNVPARRRPLPLSRLSRRTARNRPAGNSTSSETSTVPP